VSVPVLVRASVQAWALELVPSSVPEWDLESVPEWDLESVPEWALEWVPELVRAWALASVQA
jgi:hypothetical protein